MYIYVENCQEEGLSYNLELEILEDVCNLPIRKQILKEDISIHRNNRET